mgnify:CR=1 FL=1
MSKFHLFEIINLLKSQDQESLHLGMQLLKEHKNEFGKKAKFSINADKYMPIRSFPFKRVRDIFNTPFYNGTVSGRFKNFNIWTIDLEKLENAIRYQERMEKNASE